MLGMKHIFQKMLVVAILVLSMISTAKADCTVYFIWDHVMGWAELPFKVNGEYAFSITPSLKSSSAFNLYNKAIRKVIFKKPGRYVVSFENEWFEKPYYAETILNLENDEVYYIVMDATIKGFVFGEVPEKKGLKFLKQAGKKYTLNEDFVYDK